MQCDALTVQWMQFIFDMICKPTEDFDEMDATYQFIFDTISLGAVHILRQPSEGGGGVSQKLTIADKGGRGGKPNADNCWQGGVWVWKIFKVILYEHKCG